jgi:hypothetical protein
MADKLCKHCSKPIYFTKDAIDKWQTFDDKEFKNHHTLTCDKTKPRFKVGQILKFMGGDNKNSTFICRIASISTSSGDNLYVYPYYVVNYLYMGRWGRTQKTIKCKQFDLRPDVQSFENQEMVNMLYG